MTTQHPSASRTRLPILIAAWLFIIAATVTMSSGLPGVVQAETEQGTIPSLTLDSTEPGQLIIIWETPDPTPTDYRIRWAPTSENFLSYRDDNETQRGNLYPPGGVTTLTLNNLTPGDSYKVQMRSRYYNADRSVRESSGPWTATTTQRVKDHPPAAPTGLAASQVEHNSLTLSWNDPQDDRITGYRILRGPDADSLSTIEADTESASTSYADATVEPETTYRYAVVALSADGNSSQSSSMSATTPAAPKSKDPPPQRVGARQSITTTEVPADWGLKPTDLAAGSQFRLIFLSSTKRNGSPTTISNYNIFIQGRAAAGHTDIQTHSAGFKAVVCTAAADARDNTRTTGTGVPIYWLNGTKVADNYGDFYDGSWDDEANDKNESGTNGPDTSQNANYPLTGCEDNGTGSLNSTNNSLALGTTLPTVGRPNSSTSGHGPLSSNGSVTPEITRPMYGLSAVFQVATPAPGAPTGLSATARGSDEINLSWTAPDSTGGSDITGYKIESSSDAGSNWSNLVADTGNTNTAYQHAGLSPGDTRHYRVSAINSVGTSAPSNTANATTATVTDTTAPTVTSITRQDPTSSPTKSDTLTWRVTFSETVESVDPADFVITGTTATLTITAVTNSVYDVTASGGNLASVNETVTLAFATDQNIVDPSDNPLTATTPTGANDPTFELDNTVPTFVSGTANGTLIVLTFSEELDSNSLPPGEAFDVSALGNFSAPQPVVNSVAIEGTMVTLTVTPALFTDHTVTVSNNAYDDGMGRVPLKNFDGNAVQPAAIVGSYSVTNETPIGPPASLRAEAGDGRVRLVWTTPAGVDLETTNYQFRHAPGTSVPEETDWTETNNTEIFTVPLSGLANGTAHAFEVRAIRGSEVGATATVSATPLAAVCSTPDLGDRREVWSATLTVGSVTNSINGTTNAGYRRGSLGSLPQDGDSFMIGGTSYTIRDLHSVVRADGDRRRLSLELVAFRRFTPAVKEALLFHWCSDSSGFDDPSSTGYKTSNNHQADWSLYNTRELALSLPANNDATGTPDITGRALPGQTLTAGTGNVADADGLPNASDFAWQWIRITDETDTPIQDATSSTYTLTDDDVSKQVKVVMSFTDSLSGVESLTSDAYPSSSTVQRVLVSNIGQTVITQNDNAGELLILDAAQEFTTGSNGSGYTLSSIDLEMTVASTSNFPVVKLFSGSANGTEVATLTAPTNASTEKTTYTFTAPTAITLDEDTSYWVMAETGGGTWHTVGFAEDATPAPGWSIADGDEFRVPTSTGPFTKGTLVALMIRVNGTVNKPFLENFRADAGNAQVTLRWDNPEDSSITRYQYRQRVTSESAWDPDWTDIPGSGASTTSYTVGDLVNWTPYTFQIRAVRGNEPTATSAATATPEGPPLAPRNLTAAGRRHNRMVADTPGRRRAGARNFIQGPLPTGGHGHITLAEPNPRQRRPLHYTGDQQPHEPPALRGAGGSREPAGHGPVGFRQGDAAGTGFPATSSDWRCSAHPGHPRTVLG